MDKELERVIENKLKEFAAQVNTSSKKEQSGLVRDLKKDLQYLQRQVDGISEKLDEKYVTQLEFDPVRKLVYGVVSIILVGVVGALIGLIII